jgi:hypothetical protein
VLLDIDPVAVNLSTNLLLAKSEGLQLLPQKSLKPPTLNMTVPLFTSKVPDIYVMEVNVSPPSDDRDAVRKASVFLQSATIVT